MNEQTQLQYCSETLTYLIHKWNCKPEPVLRRSYAYATLLPATVTESDTNSHIKKESIKNS